LKRKYPGDEVDRIAVEDKKRGGVVILGSVTTLRGRTLRFECNKTDDVVIFSEA
jgi:hypothetical protein